MREYLLRYPLVGIASALAVDGIVKSLIVTMIGCAVLTMTDNRMDQS